MAAWHDGERGEKQYSVANDRQRAAAVATKREAYQQVAAGERRRK